MAKDLPYFKFVISEWNDGDVTLCSLEAQGLFINLCSIYWSQEGKMSLDKSKRRFSGCNASAWEQLINDKVIKVKGDRIIINFLDEQFKERGKLSEQNSENASKGWEKRRNNTVEMRPHTGGINPASNIEEKREEEKKKEENITEENARDFDELFLKAFDEQTCESYKLAFRGFDLGAELQRFRTKCDNDKAKYYGRDVGGLRSAFQYQLQNFRNNGNSKDKRTEHVTGLAEDFAKRHGSGS
jgi:hypothetical protein